MNNRSNSEFFASGVKHFCCFNINHFFHTIPNHKCNTAILLLRFVVW